MADLTGPNPAEMNGDVAHDAVDAGNPVKVGGRADSAIPAVVSAGDRVQAWYGLSGQQIVSLGVGASTAGADGANQVGVSNPTAASASYLPMGVAGYVFNGTAFDRARAIASLSAAPNVDTGIQAVGIGPGWDRKNDPAGVPATGTSGTTNAVTVIVNGADVVTFQVTAIGTTPGSMIIETTADDTNWATAGAVLKLGVEQWVNGAFVPAVNDVYMVRTTGIRQVRYRVNAAYASGTATVKVTGSVGAAIVKGIDVASAPHNIGYTISSFSNKFTSTQTSINLIAGTTGKRIYVTGVRIATGGTTAGRVTIYWGTGAFSVGTSPTLFDGEFIPSTTAAPGAVIPLPWAPGASSATGDNLRITTSAGITVYVTIDYYVA